VTWQRTRSPSQLSPPSTSAGSRDLVQTVAAGFEMSPWHPAHLTDGPTKSSRCMCWPMWGKPHMETIARTGRSWRAPPHAAQTTYHAGLLASVPHPPRLWLHKLCTFVAYRVCATLWDAGVGSLHCARRKECRRSGSANLWYLMDGNG
jgi:hypothetical protein